MSSLRLVKPLSHLHQEKKLNEEIVLESYPIAIPHGTITEISGERSTGKTSFGLALLAQLTSRGSICSLIDGGDRFDPCTARLAGVKLENLLWIRCGGDIEKAFIAADQIVMAKGFGCVWLDLTGLPTQKLRMVPRTYWFRYRTRIKDTPTVMFVTSEEPITGSASQTSYRFDLENTIWSGTGKFKLLREFRIKMHGQRQLLGRIDRVGAFVDHSEVEA